MNEVLEGGWGELRWRSASAALSRRFGLDGTLSQVYLEGVKVPTLVVLLAFLVLGAWACTREPERQWYKIGQRYTMEEFRRDTKECTRGGELDVACMRGRGWVDVGPDRPGPPPEEPGKTFVLPKL